MIDHRFKLGSALALLTSLGLTSSARGESEAGPARAAEELPVRAEDPVSAHVSPEFVARLALLEAGRRQQRALSFTDPKAWAAGRPARAAQHRQEIAQLWGNVVNSIDGQAKLRMHAERMARLNRMLDLADHAANSALIARIRKDITRELVRHAQSMQQTVATWGGQ